MGPVWNGIRIGSASVDDLRDYIDELSSSYTEHYNSSLQTISFNVLRRIADSEEIPTLIEACINPDSHVVTAIYVTTTTLSEEISLRKLVVEYDSPELVMWSTTSNSRIAGWLEEGVAASVSVDESEQFVPYGAVTLMVYFPYQLLEGYEERWPYTHRASSKADLVTLTPDVPYEINPFDFDAIIATITAQPTRTATPTLTPVATEAP